MQLVRFDREILDNIGWMADTYQEDNNLVLHTLILIAYDVQYNVFNETLFGSKIWDPYKIAPILGFATKTLINKVDERNRRELLQLSVDSRKAYIESRESAGYPLWDTALCNAIYILMEQSKIDNTVNIRADESRVSSLRRIQVFNKADKLKTRRNKIFYEVQYSKSYVSKLVKNFSRFDIDLLVKLPPSCRILYLGLMNARDNANYKNKLAANNTTMVEFAPAVNTLFKWANCSQKNPRENMRTLRKKIATINEVERELTKRQENEPDFVSASFPGYMPTIAIQYSTREIEMRNLDNQDRFKQILLRNLKDSYRYEFRDALEAMNPSSFYTQFTDWLIDLKKGYEPKMKALEETYMMVFGNLNYFENNKFNEFKTIIPELVSRVKPNQFEILYDR